MKIKVRIIIAASVILNLILVWQIYAGNTDSPAEPGATNSYTLEDIYQRLDDGTAGAQSTFTEPGVAPGTGTMHTLNDIMGLAPTLDDTDGATTTHVISGTTFWGLNSTQWGLQTGTLVASGPTIIMIAATGATRETGAATDGVGGNRDDFELTTGISWPNPRFTIAATGIVTDNLTGLIWLRDANCSYFTAVDWQTQMAEVNNLASGTCSLTDSSIAGDWRMPNVNELATLTDFGFDDPAVPNTAGTGQWTQGNPFNNIISSGQYWTSTDYAGNPGAQKWVINMRGGFRNFTGVTGNHKVWPVRGP
ncbi:MAG: DUF1566 domain-containing protein [Chloroflexi bacterium]|nr:DUF1566 domain-containing protein [Chloroflexota bacterium]